PRRHSRHEGGRLRGEHQGRAEGLRGHEGRGGRGVGHRLPARGAAVPAARGQEAHAPDVDPGAGLSRRRLRDEGRETGAPGRVAEGERRREGREEMKTVARDEILDFVTYEERRGPIREAAMRAKAERR